MSKAAVSFFLAIVATTNFAAAQTIAAPEKTTESPAVQSSSPIAPVDQLIPWLLDEDRQLRGIPFAEVILDTTGKHVLAVDAKNETDQRVIKKIGAACDETMKRMNAPDSTIQNVARINEVSSHFEDTLRELLNSTPGFHCDF